MTEIFNLEAGVKDCIGFSLFFPLQSPASLFQDYSWESIIFNGIGAIIVGGIIIAALAIIGGYVGGQPNKDDKEIIPRH